MQEEKNRATLEVLQLTLKLVEFWAFGDALRVKKLMFSLTGILSGASDETVDPAALALSGKDNPVLGSLRYRESSATKLTIACKVVVCNIFSKLFEFDLDLRLSEFSRKFADGNFKSRGRGQDVTPYRNRVAVDPLPSVKVFGCVLFEREVLQCCPCLGASLRHRDSRDDAALLDLSPKAPTLRSEYDAELQPDQLAVCVRVCA